MAKDPAFLFYPNDYIGGTMGMTFEEKGAYIELLMTQFNRGHMTEHMIGQIVGQLWVKLKDKFIKDEQGLYYNVRLEEEKIKRQNFTNSRRNNLTGKNQHSKNKKNKRGHMTKHMENVNVNEIIDYFISKGYKKEAAIKFYDFYKTANWTDSNGNKVLNWKQKAISVWFKDENKIQVKKQEPNYQDFFGTQDTLSHDNSI